MISTLTSEERRKGGRKRGRNRVRKKGGTKERGRETRIQLQLHRW